eukprot:365261-Lingulodinium_polyedra.AAC.1
MENASGTPGTDAQPAAGQPTCTQHKGGSPVKVLCRPGAGGAGPADGSVGRPTGGREHGGREGCG